MFDCGHQARLRPTILLEDINWTPVDVNTLFLFKIVLFYKW